MFTIGHIMDQNFQWTGHYFIETIEGLSRGLQEGRNVGRVWIEQEEGCQQNCEHADLH